MLNEFHYYSAYPTKKPLLTEKQKNIRLQWALENYNTNWFEVIFSDETTIVKDSVKKKYGLVQIRPILRE